MTTIAEHVIELVERRPGLTASEIASDLFGSEKYAGRLTPFCREMVTEGRLVRRGRGGVGKPFRYFLTKQAALFAYAKAEVDQVGKRGQPPD